MSSVYARVFVCVLSVILPLVSTATEANECSLPSSGVFVSISSEESVVEGVHVRWLVINWYDIQIQDTDYFKLVNTDSQETLVRLTVSDVDTVSGVFVTHVKWDPSLIPDNVVDGGESEACLPYRADYVHDNKTLYSSCLKIHPHWMRLMMSDLMDVRMSRVVIPGTHDAGATTHYGTLPPGNIVAKWTYTQDDSLWMQLVRGVRYLDMRISYYNNTVEKFFVNHGEIRIAPLRYYVEDVVKFMNETDEVVIFDIHSLEHGLSDHPERQYELVEYLESYLGLWMVPRSLAPNPTMGEVWRSGGRLVVTFPSGASSSSLFLWDPVHHLWANANNVDDLQKYLYDNIPGQVNRGSLWSVMGQLTPTPLDVTLNKWNGLRGAATVTNYRVTAWLRRDWWDQVNVIAMDFLPFSDVVTVAVEANKLRRLCPYTS